MLKTNAADFGGGRKRPYTTIGIRRLMCSVSRCDREGYATWSSCADGNIYRIFCAEHDAEINAMVLRWAGDPDWEAKSLKYIRKLEAEVGRSVEIDWVAVDA